MDADLSTVLDLARASSDLMRRIDRPLGSDHGVSLNDLRLLLALQASPNGRLRRVELAERLGITPSGVARQLGPLERIGVVDRERHATDARLALAVLTKAGDALATNGARTAADVAHTALGAWTDDDRATCAALLAKLG